uniref:Uncharacterized protein n=1 Tax=Salix viminalis TaxID=40686 RepID=A0A6N2MUC4_SALVM
MEEAQCLMEGRRNGLQSKFKLSLGLLGAQKFKFKIWLSDLVNLFEMVPSPEFEARKARRALKGTAFDESPKIVEICKLSPVQHQQRASAEMPTLSLIQPSRITWQTRMQSFKAKSN